MFTERVEIGIDGIFNAVTDFIDSIGAAGAARQVWNVRGVASVIGLLDNVDEFHEFLISARPAAGWRFQFLGDVPIQLPPPATTIGPAQRDAKDHMVAASHTVEAPPIGFEKLDDIPVFQLWRDCTKAIAQFNSGPMRDQIRNPRRHSGLWVKLMRMRMLEGLYTPGAKNGSLRAFA